MIPSSFDYVAPDSLEDALTALTEAGDEAKVLAGGQSLLPVLRLRMAAPGVLVDLRKITELHGVRRDGDDIVVGAMTTHAEVVENPLLAEHVALADQDSRDGRRSAGAASRHPRRRAGARRSSR